MAAAPDAALQELYLSLGTPDGVRTAFTGLGLVSVPLVGAVADADLQQAFADADVASRTSAFAAKAAAVIAINRQDGLGNATQQDQLLLQAIEGSRVTFKVTPPPEALPLARHFRKLQSSPLSYVDLGEMVNSSASIKYEVDLKGSLVAVQSTTRQASISSPADWFSCFMKYATALLLIGSQPRPDNFVLDPFSVLVYANRVLRCMATHGVALGYQYDKAYRQRLQGWFLEANGAVTPSDLFRRDRDPSLLSYTIAMHPVADSSHQGAGASTGQSSKVNPKQEFPSGVDLSRFCNLFGSSECVKVWDSTSDSELLGASEKRCLYFMILLMLLLGQEAAGGGLSRRAKRVRVVDPASGDGALFEDPGHLRRASDGSSVNCWLPVLNSPLLSLSAFPLLAVILSCVDSSRLPALCDRVTGSPSPAQQVGIDGEVDQVVAEVLRRMAAAGVDVSTSHVGGTVRPHILQALLEEVGDPESQLPRDLWLGRELDDGVNIGLRCPISATGLYPVFAGKSVKDDPLKLVWSTSNYLSAEGDLAPLVHQVLMQDVQSGFLRPAARAEVKHVCRLAAISKVGDTGPTVRLIEDHLRSGLNGLLSCDESCALPYLSDLHSLVSAVRAAGAGLATVQLDIRHAFRTIRVHPCDVPLLGLSHSDSFYLNLSLPFGLRSSPYWWTRFASCLHRISHFLVRLSAGSLTTPGSSAALPLEGGLVYVDDVTYVTSDEKRAGLLLALLCVLWALVGCSIAYHKVVVTRFSRGPASTKILGFALQSDSAGVLSLGIPQNKLDMVSDQLRQLLSSSKVPVSVLSKLAGRLQWMGQLAPFIRPLLASLYGAYAVAQRRNLRFFPLSPRSNLSTSARELSRYIANDRIQRAISVFGPGSSLGEPLVLSCDASTVALAGLIVLEPSRVFKFRVFVRDLPYILRAHLLRDVDIPTSRDISRLEALAAAITLLLARDLDLPGARPLLLRCDNAGVVHMLQKCYSRDEALQPLFRLLAREVFSHRLSRGDDSVCGSVLGISGALSRVLAVYTSESRCVAWVGFRVQLVTLRGFVIRLAMDDPVAFVGPQSALVGVLERHRLTTWRLVAMLQPADVRLVSSGLSDADVAAFARLCVTARARVSVPLPPGSDRQLPSCGRLLPARFVKSRPLVRFRKRALVPLAVRGAAQSAAPSVAVSGSECLDPDVADFITAGLEWSTRRSYDNVVKLYKSSLLPGDIAFPLSGNTLCRFIYRLSEAGYAVSTIETYARSIQAARALTAAELVRLGQYSGPVPIDIKIAAILAIFGLLRVDEVLSLNRGDLVFSESGTANLCLRVTLRKSKTDGTGSFEEIAERDGTVVVLGCSSPGKTSGCDLLSLKEFGRWRSSAVNTYLVGVTLAQAPGYSKRMMAVVTDGDR
ncbi:hypothetical protein FOZ60_001601 [Perkinsus olseni]|uniref:Uncharacterized protein n=1 Tax=Perkinsus olseni TaxID=32597 RepID=A0A7J6P090_PEROL|nr:hypothetical protein FOZ60_001601 [Perkinsus olseni]